MAKKRYRVKKKIAWMLGLTRDNQPFGEVGPYSSFRSAMVDAKVMAREAVRLEKKAGYDQTSLKTIMREGKEWGYIVVKETGERQKYQPTPITVIEKSEPVVKMITAVKKRPTVIDVVATNPRKSSKKKSARASATTIAKRYARSATRVAMAPTRVGLRLIPLAVPGVPEEATRRAGAVLRKADQRLGKDDLFKKGLRKNGADGGSKVQTLIFDKTKFTPASAKAWAEKHGFKGTKTDITSGSIRIRQLDPSLFRKETFGTIPFREGVQAVIGVPKPKAKIKTRSNGGGDVTYLAHTIRKRGLKWSVIPYNQMFSTLDEAKAWLRGHVARESKR